MKDAMNRPNTLSGFGMEKMGKAASYTIARTRNVIYEMEDRSGGVRIWYKEKGEPGSGYIVADSSAVLPGMIIDHDKNFEDIEVKNLYTIFFTSQEECKEFCDFLNRKADYKGYGYDMEGKLVRDALMTETGFTNGSEQEEKHE